MRPNTPAGPSAAIKTDIAAIESLFAQPQYQAVLVDDQNTLYKGQPYFRTNALDPPTIWELEQHSKSTDGSIQLKFQDTDIGQ